MPRKNGLNSEAFRARLGTAQGKQYWRSLEELAETDEFREFLHREFPHQASEWEDGPSRREFLKLMGASLALAGLGGCARQPEEEIVPYVRMPEQVVPGKPMYFATAMPLGGTATGLLVESHMGRPTKVEGNPEHPAVPAVVPVASEHPDDLLFRPGPTTPFAQAAVLTLYDPDRSRTVADHGRISAWGAFLNSLRPRLDVQRAGGGAGLRILTETVTSPTLAAQLQSLLEEFPAARWHQYEPVHRDNARAGARLAFGEDVNIIHRFGEADVVLALDAEFLSGQFGRLHDAREFMQRRYRQIERSGRTGDGREPEMTRLYVVESTPTTTGAAADHRLPLRSVEIEALVRAVAVQLGVDVAPPDEAALTHVPPGWVDAVADDLRNYRLRDEPGASLVVAGECQPPIVHALVHAINDVLGNVGRSVVYTEPVMVPSVDQTESLRELVEEMRAGQVEMLVILGGNPVFTAPADFAFAEALAEVPFRVHQSLYQDETSVLCHWHIPETHFLETWSDARAYDGTVTILQPLIAPLYAGRSTHELLAALRGQPGRTAHDIVRDFWQREWEEADGRNAAAGFDEFWQTALHQGVVAETKLPEIEVSVRTDFADQGPFQQQRDETDSATASHGNPLELVFRPDPTIWDGRFANNGWLQELPKPLTKLTWDNVAIVSPNTAGRRELEKGSVVELRHGGRSLRMPVWILPGQPDGSITVHFGYGRRRAGRVGNGRGFNVYTLRTSDAPWFASGVELIKTEEHYPLAGTQQHHLMEARDLVRSGTLVELQEQFGRPEFLEANHERDPHPEHQYRSLYPDWPYDGYKWGMAINLTTCIGCNACVVACQAENNIPVVGKSQVANGREMHWLRIDHYYEGEPDNPQTYHQPVLCMHCEKAPCEVVCPVAATSHSDEGLNEMTYNRCVGTRYCSNNCPYKVRRFNFLDYAHEELEAHPSLKLMQNPDVTVRSIGVMEKCTYCVQRISAGRIEAEKEDRRIRDGDVVTACQAACPTEAIVFGDLNDPQSRLNKVKNVPLNYELLGELNTRPRTTYTAAVRNPNPALGRGEG